MTILKSDIKLNYNLNTSWNNRRFINIYTISNTYYQLKYHKREFIQIKINLQVDF